MVNVLEELSNPFNEDSTDLIVPDTQRKFLETVMLPLHKELKL